MTPSDLSISAATIAQSFGSRNCQLAASWCYAKIAPAALQRGNFGSRLRECAEAADWKPKFEMSDSRCLSAGTATPVAQRPRLA
jgi:hypothetical protein